MCLYRDLLGLLNRAYFPNSCIYPHVHDKGFDLFKCSSSLGWTVSERNQKRLWSFIFVFHEVPHYAICSWPFCIMIYYCILIETFKILQHSRSSHCHIRTPGKNYKIATLFLKFFFVDDSIIFSSTSSGRKYAIHFNWICLGYVSQSQNVQLLNDN